jgi:hypothetical protein
VTLNPASAIAFAARLTSVGLKVVGACLTPPPVLATRGFSLRGAQALQRGRAVDSDATALAAFTGFAQFCAAFVIAIGECRCSFRRNNLRTFYRGEVIYFARRVFTAVKTVPTKHFVSYVSVQTLGRACKENEDQHVARRLFTAVAKRVALPSGRRPRFSLISGKNIFSIFLASLSPCPAS